MSRALSALVSLCSADTSLSPLPHVTRQALCLFPAARTLAALCDGTVTLVSTDTLEGVAFAAARGATHLCKVRRFCLLSAPCLPRD